MHSDVYYLAFTVLALCSTAILIYALATDNTRLAPATAAFAVICWLALIAH